ncbi:hypothetical protein [Emticicia fontis]
MAFATKYRVSFKTLEGPSKVPAIYTLVFKKDGYAGIITDLPDMGAGNVTAKINNSQDEYIGIRDKTLSIDILTSSDLSELLVANPKEWLVEIEKTVGPATTLDFRGYLQVSKDSTPYQDGRINYKLQACDGLDFLKNIDFVDDSSVYYTGLSSIFDIIRLCLIKVGTSLNLNTINNIFNIDDDKSDSSDSLRQRYIDLDLFRGENEPLDTYKVLGDILKTERMRLFQEDGEWWLVYVPELSDGQAKSRKYYLNDGAQISYGDLDLSVNAIHNSVNYQPLSGGSVSNLSPIKYAKITHKLGKWKNKLINNDFRTWNGSSFDGWEAFGGATIGRTGDGTSGNPFGVLIPGYYVSPTVKGIAQTVTIFNAGDPLLNLEKNIVFSGSAYTRDIETISVACYVRIITFDYGAFVFGLNEDGEWERNKGSIIIKNSDVNGHSKKTPVTWDVTSKNVADLQVISVVDGTIFNWKGNLQKVEIIVQLAEGKTQLNPYPGETQDSAVWFKNLTLGWINADTNLNLKEIYYKATQAAYSPNNEELDAIYGDYTDGGNLSALRNNAGFVTKSWISPTETTGRNFHSIGAQDILYTQSKTQKVYDGDIWGLLKYRHIVDMRGFVNKGYIVSYSYNYAQSIASVRIIEFQDSVSVIRKKTGVLTDGTEINMVDETVPSPGVGNGTGGSFIKNLFDWVKKLINGVVVDDEEGNIGILNWSNLVNGQIHDMGSVVRQDGKLRVGKDDDSIEIGKSDSITKVVGDFVLQNINNAKAFFSLDFLQTNKNYTFKLPDANPDGITVLNDWNYLVNVPTFFFTQDTAANTWIIPHNKGQKCMCQTFDETGKQIFGSIMQINDNELQVTFNSSETGYALLMGIKNI